VGMEKYEQQYPHADVVLFEPEREDADMFFANIFSYSQRRRLCADAFAKTRQSLRARTAKLAPTLVRHGIRLREDRLAQLHRTVADAVTDPRPLHTSPKRTACVRQATRDLGHTLSELERWLALQR
jgi:NTE family protein